MPLAPLNVGLFRTSATYYSSIVSVIPGDGRLVTEWRVVCMCPERGLVRVVHTAIYAPTGLRAGAFCKCVGGSDVSEMSPKTCVLAFLFFLLGSHVLEEPIPERLHRMKAGTKYSKPS